MTGIRRIRDHAQESVLRYRARCPIAARIRSPPLVCARMKRMSGVEECEKHVDIEQATHGLVIRLSVVEVSPFKQLRDHLRRDNAASSRDDVPSIPKGRASRLITHCLG